MGSCYRSQRKICCEKGEDISIVKNREKEGSGVYEGSVEKGIHLTIKVITNITSILCAKEDLLRDMAEDVVVFIDDVMVGTETEEEP